MDSEKVSIRDPMMEDTDVDEKKSKKKEIISYHYWSHITRNRCRSHTIFRSIFK